MLMNKLFAKLLKVKLEEDLYKISKRCPPVQPHRFQSVSDCGKDTPVKGQCHEIFNIF
jgi:hypothetical protein